MPWFKVDDKLHDHRKSRRARKAPMGVWVLAGSWAADNLTDGFVPASVLPRWGTRADAKALVDADLWETHEKDGEKGWLFRNWSEYQPTKAEVEAEREKKADAGRKGGRASGRSRREARAKADASSFVEPPTRPDPTRPSTAAAADTTPPPHPVENLPGELAILRSKLDAHKLTVRWDKLNPEQTAEIIDLVRLHGDTPLVRAAKNAYQPNDPIVFAQGWLKHWRAIPEPTQRLTLVRRFCDTHKGTELTPDGTCQACVIDAKVADR